jgi:hypothetical protein
MSESNLFQTNEPGQPSSLFEMNLDAQNSYNLRSSASWAKVLGVVGIMTGVILIIMMVITLSRVENVSRYSRYDRNDLQDIFAAKTSLWILILSGIIFIIGGVFSFSFGNKMNTALKANDQNGLNAGFAALRNYFALRSITIIIVLLILLLGLAQMV